MNKLPIEIQDIIVEYSDLDVAIAYNNEKIINKKLMYYTWYTVLLEASWYSISYLINKNFDTDTLEYLKRCASTEYLEYCIINKQSINKLNLLNSLFSYGSISCEIYDNTSKIYKDWIDIYYPYTMYDHRLLYVNPKLLHRVNYL